MMCSKCGENERYPKSSYCRSCKNELGRTWYERRDRDRVNQTSSLRRREVTRKIGDLKEASPCVDCGRFDHYFLMEYDHLDANTKDDGIATMVSKNKSWQTILDEIAKCELVCIRCHRIRTHARSNREELPSLTDEDRQQVKEERERERRERISKARSGTTKVDGHYVTTK